MRGRTPTLKPIAGGLLKAPPMPRSMPPEAAEDWATTAADLQGRGLLQPAVVPLVEAYVGALHVARQCRAALYQDGPIVRTANGNPKPHPAAGLFNRANETISRLAAELGLTALGRSREGIRKQERVADAAADPLAEFDL